MDYESFAKEPLHIDDIVVYLKNERTGSSTVRKCKFVGQVVGFTGRKVQIRQFSNADQFVCPNECKDYGVVFVYPEDVVHVIDGKELRTHALSDAYEFLCDFDSNLRYQENLMLILDTLDFALTQLDSARESRDIWCNKYCELIGQNGTKKASEFEVIQKNLDEGVLPPLNIESKITNGIHVHQNGWT